MATSQQASHRRHWADVLAIVTGVALLGLAIWPGPHSASAGAEREAGNAQALWLAHALAGASALISVGIAQRWGLRPLARALLLIAALALAVLLFMFRDFGPRALLTVLLPALLLLISATAVGPMPRDL